MSTRYLQQRCVPDQNHPCADHNAQELVDRIEAAMLQRLRDKAPAVRAEAAAVLARLAQPDEVRLADIICGEITGMNDPCCAMN